MQNWGLNLKINYKNSSSFLLSHSTKTETRLGNLTRHDPFNTAWWFFGALRQFKLGNNSYITLFRFIHELYELLDNGVEHNDSAETDRQDWSNNNFFN